jgi:hypothetical protein
MSWFFALFVSVMGNLYKLRLNSVKRVTEKRIMMHVETSPEKKKSEVDALQSNLNVLQKYLI